MKHKDLISLGAGMLLLLLGLASLWSLAMPRGGNREEEKCRLALEDLLSRESCHLELGEDIHLYKYGGDLLITGGGEGYLEKEGRTYTLGTSDRLSAPGPVWDYSPGLRDRDIMGSLRQLLSWQDCRYQRLSPFRVTLTAREGQAELRFDLLGRLREVRAEGTKPLVVRVRSGRKAAGIIESQNVTLCREFQWQGEHLVSSAVPIRDPAGAVALGERFCPGPYEQARVSLDREQSIWKVEFLPGGIPPVYIKAQDCLSGRCRRGFFLFLRRKMSVSYG